MCEKHSPTVQVAEGSANVFIDGGTYRYLPVDDEVPAWLRYTVDILMAVASGAKILVGLYKLGLQQGLKAAVPCALRFMVGVIAGCVRGGAGGRQSRGRPARQPATPPRPIG